MMQYFQQIENKYRKTYAKCGVLAQNRNMIECSLKFTEWPIPDTT